MGNTSYKALLKDYKNYTHSKEALAVFLTRNYVKKLETKSKWIDVISYDSWGGAIYDKILLNYFVIELFTREINPTYPKEETIQDKNEYINICKALTWEASHTDIDQQRAKGKRGPMYLVACPVINVNKGKKYMKAFPFWNEEYGGFDHTGNAPTTTIYREVEMKSYWEYVVTGFVEINDHKLKMIRENYDEFIRPKIIDNDTISVDWFLEDYQLAKSKLKKAQEQKKAKTQPYKSGTQKKKAKNT